MKKQRCYLPLLFVLIMGASFASAQIQTASITGGRVHGEVVGKIGVFKGIPFAAPPVGNLRWQAPQPLVLWQGEKQATTFGAGCIQEAGMAKQLGSTGSLSEDCLYLNVWTPAKTTNEKLPVIVWIYGGGFNSGLTETPMYNGQHFAEKGVVLVSIAYRVGPFAFLAHPDLSKESGKGSGNYGLQDMIAGLEWVRANVAQFGGDPARVTIFGHSAGGMAVSMLAASPAAKGLFQGVISMSGGSFAPSMKTGSEAGMRVPSLSLAEANGKRFLQALGVSDINAARALSADKIQAGIAASKLAFWPVADGNILPGDQYELYQAGRFNDTPVLIGNTSDEAAVFRPAKATAADFEMQIKANYGDFAANLLAAYPHGNDADTYRSIKGVQRETSFAWPTWSWAKLQTSKGKGKAYVYFFDHHTPETDGAGHGSDVPYVFQTLDTRGVPTPENLALSDQMSSYWVNFATTGNPNGAGLPQWPAFMESKHEVMVFQDAPAAQPIPNKAKLEAFDPYYAWRREQTKE